MTTVRRSKDDKRHNGQRPVGKNEAVICEGTFGSDSSVVTRKLDQFDGQTAEDGRQVAQSHVLAGK